MKTNFEFLDSYSASYDIPDSRDITADDLDLLGSAEIPDKMQYSNTPILSQGSIGACTIFGLSGATFESTYTDAVENGGVYSQPFDVWDRWSKAKLRGASDTGGWSLQGALSLLTDIKDIVGYAKLSGPGSITLEKIAQAIASGRMIYTGSARGNWRQVGSTHIYEESANFAGHAYCIVGYDCTRRVAIARNSWTDQWGDRGHFYIPESLLPRLYSTYIILDPSDVEKMRDIRNIRAKNYADDSKNFKVWNGENPNSIATDSEIHTMIDRALKVTSPMARIWYASQFDEKILRGK